MYWETGKREKAKALGNEILNEQFKKEGSVAMEVKHYIKECLDSIFMQETNYSYQLIVADDHSTDNSVEIIKEYQAKYPNKITLLESDVNQKLYKNVLRAYEITKTPYFTVQKHLILQF